jgi:pectin methylesterase-like acyl-CoA thioesterase
MKPVRHPILLAALAVASCAKSGGGPGADASAPPVDTPPDLPLTTDPGPDAAAAGANDAPLADARAGDAGVDLAAAVDLGPDVGGATCQLNFSLPAPVVDGGAAPAVSPGASLPAAITGVFPAVGALDACVDAQLRVGFASAVKAGKAGRIQVWQTAGLDGGAPEVIDTIDLADGGYSKKIGGKSFYYWPLVFEGNVATIILHAPLPAGGTFAVTFESGVFVDAAGAALPGITDSGTWTFSTTATAPAAKPALTVALDGSGDTCTVQGALDRVPAGNATPIVITIKAGNYRELVYAAGKNNVTLHGEDRERTVIGYANNENCNKGTASRALFTISGGSTWVIENLTIHNQAPQVSTNAQAEALHVEAAGKIIVRNANLYSNQDTLLLNGQVYVADSLIKGNVDYIWGTGTAYFDRCEIRTVARAGYNVQARNPAGSYGYVFVDCKLTADSPAITGHYLARTNFSDPSGAPACQVAYVNCQLGSHIDPKGWLVAASGVDNSKVRFWEYQSVDPTGAPVDTSQRIGASQQIDDATAAQMRDVTVVLGGWNPKP